VGQFGSPERSPSRVGSSGSSAAAARVFAGLGAYGITSAILNAAAFVLLFGGVLRVASGPPRFEPLLLPSYLVGAFVAYRVGGRRGVVALLALAVWSLAYTLYRAWPEGAIEAARFDRPFPASVDLDFVIPQTWAFAGIATGALIARWWRTDVPLRLSLGVLGLLVAASAIWRPLHWIGSVQLCSTPRFIIEGPCWAASELIGTAWLLAAGSATGIIAARHGVGREVLPAALALAMPSAVITFYQGATASAGLILPGIVSVAGGVIVSIALVLAYAVAQAVEVLRHA
jgi:hypothetical protein